MEIKNYTDIDFSKIIRIINIIIPAQDAKLGPPVGPVLGQVKVKIKNFCLQFNEATSSFEFGIPLRITIFVYNNETYNFIIKMPSISFLLKNYLVYNNKTQLTQLDLYKICIIKKADFPFLSLQNIFINILSICKSMKIKLNII